MKLRKIYKNFFLDHAFSQSINRTVKLRTNFPFYQLVTIAIRKAQVCIWGKLKFQCLKFIDVFLLRKKFWFRFTKCQFVFEYIINNLSEIYFNFPYCAFIQYGKIKIFFSLTLTLHVLMFFSLIFYKIG